MDREIPTLRADDMGRHASAFVERATAKARLPLDYTAASLRVVDRLVDGLRRGGARREDVAGPLLGIGAYVGEVLAHEAGAVWVDIPPGHLLRSVFAHPVGSRMPDGRVWNPLGRTVNRFELGPQESLQTYFLTLHGRRPPRTRTRGVRAPDGRATGRS
ncbi:hypothetical protein [Streptomyces zaomyceticus]|uniref:hypothetical protein n=1 Tax=Streptomyces zaomyceticus TaxID=68286 RepID=UPI00167A4C23|nr:hypothetical protein [Streptomyces zaomyceticus]GHF99270.1 hypothetical protein GCM10018791_07900 [Streptomyces zaomyceticus]